MVTTQNFNLTGWIQFFEQQKHVCVHWLTFAEYKIPPNLMA